MQYKTDVENDYFDRDSDPGIFILKVNDNEIGDFSVNLWNGIANLNVKLPDSVRLGDFVCFESVVSDVSKIEPLVEKFWVVVEGQATKTPSKKGARKPPASDEKGKDAEQTSFLDLPELVEVRESEWDKHGFNRESALRVVDSGEGGNDFFINMDNVHLLTEKKANTKLDNRLLDARYKYGMVLLGIALLKDDMQKEEKDNTEESESFESLSVYEKINFLTRVTSPILLPMISGLGELDEEEIRQDMDID